MKLKSNFLIIYYFSLYLSLITGFYFNEDFAGGFEYDFQIHEGLIKDLFNDSLLFGLLNYDRNYVPHSPIFIIYLVFLQKLFVSEVFLRLINLHIFLLIPWLTAVCLKIKYELKNDDFRLLLPSIFFISPFFRAGAIWTDDNIFAIIFFLIAILYFTKYEKNKSEFKYIIFCSFFLALTSYFRPIYCLFSIYFTLIFLINLKFSKKFFYYVLINILLAFPAFYYVFILEINKWAVNYIFRENFITHFSLSSSIIFFYLFPFIYYQIYKKRYEILNIKSLIISIILISLLISFFEYNRSYSGGIIFKLSNLFFNNHYLFFVISTLGTLIIFMLFLKDKKSIKNVDILLIIILYTFEIDGIVYHETYDPLIYILILFLFKNEIIKQFVINFDKNKFLVLFSFISFFYFASILKTIIY